MQQEFEAYLRKANKSENTVKSYGLHVKGLIKWYADTFGTSCKRMYRENLLDYISYLRTVRKANGRTINAILAALVNYNEFLIEKGIQENHVVTKADYIKIQSQYASPAIVSKQEVEKFRQEVLVNQGKRDYAIVTLLAYGGLRISEALSLSLDDISLTAREIVVTDGKGGKQRTVFINDKIINALKEYLKERKGSSRYLFTSRTGRCLNRTRMNQIFKQFSDDITPHTLRHFYCSNALESGYAVHEVANQAGHSNIQTT